MKHWQISIQRNGSRVVFYFFEGPHADEQNLSTCKEATVICQGENSSPAAQRHHKGTPLI